MCRTLIVMASLAGLLVPATAVAAEADCAWPSDYVSPAASRPISPGELRALKRNATTGEILRRFGPARRDVGSGVFVLEWALTDGGVFVVSAVNACARPLSRNVLPAKGAKPR